MVNNPSQAIEFLGPKDSIGLNYIDSRSRQPSSATYTVNSEGEFRCLVMHAMQYKEILQRFQDLESAGNQAFLKKNRLFFDWGEAKMDELCRQSMSKVLQTKDQIIAKQGHPITHVIFVKTGRLRLEKDIQIERSNFWPAGSHEWEVKVNSAFERRKIMEFPPNTFFGVVNDADPKSDQAKVYPGYIVSDEDNTSILMVPNSVF